MADAVMTGRERTISGIADQLAAFIEVVDAAFNKLALPQRSQVYVQVLAAIVCAVIGSKGMQQ